MLLLTRTLFAIPLVAAALGALLSTKGVAAHVLPRTSALHSRGGQIYVPEQCVDICDEYQCAFDDCETLECACTLQNMDYALECFDCIGDVADGQEAINTIATDCYDAGYPVGYPTVVPDDYGYPTTTYGGSYTTGY